MLTITSQKSGQNTAYQLLRSSENQFNVAVDWDKSPGVRSGGYGLNFTEDRLEIRGFSEDAKFDVLVAPEEYKNSVFILPYSPPGFRGGADAEPAISRVDFPTPIAADQSRKVALQVASAVIGIPFLETMLDMEIPKA